MAMAETLWRVRFRAAAAVLFVAVAGLTLLDLLARPELGDNSATLTALVLVFGAAAVVAALLPWERWSKLVRLIPPAAVLGATLIAVSATDAAATSYAPVSLTIVAVLVTGYIGFTTSPGWALGASPLILVALLLARQSQPNRVSLILPLVAVPVAALTAELISLLSYRLERGDGLSRRRADRLGRLEDVLRQFRRPGTLTEAANQVAKAAIDIFDVERSTVVLRDSAGGLIPVSIGPSTDREPDAVTADLVAETILGDTPRLVPTGSNGTMLVLPLPAQDAPAGAVLVYPVPTDDPDFTIDLARLFSVQVSIAIEHLFVIDELNKATTRDALTGIGNRRHADALLKSLQAGDALVLLDLDFLKTVNDTLGHAAGDQVLQELSAHLRTVLRDSDTSARLGGDEFLVVARRAHADPLAVADRILAGWVGKGGLTTLSAGVALHDADVSVSETFDRADSALYGAKRAGKDQAKLWQPEDSDGPANPGTDVAAPST